MEVSNAITPSSPEGTSISAIGREGYFASIRDPPLTTTTDDAADVARLMIGFRDWQGRTEPSDASIEASVRRLLADPNTDYLLGGRPAGRRPPAPLPALRLDRDGRRCISRICSSARTRAAPGSAASWLRRPWSGRASGAAARMLLDTNEANEAAVRLYESVGFRSGSDETGGRDLFMRLRL